MLHAARKSSPQVVHCRNMLALIIMITWCCYTQAEVAVSTRYTTKYDNVDLNEIVKNERLLKSYVDCLLEKGKCSPDGLELKKNMPDAVQTDCSKCSETQKEGSEFIIKFLIDNKPSYWKPLEEKYDPTGQYQRKYLESKNAEVDIKPAKKH